MLYSFTLTFAPTDGSATTSRVCRPVWSNDLTIVNARESGEWYYTRKLEGRLIFLRDDYAYIMGSAFDGTFTLTISESHDNGATWHAYFEGTFSRASLEIDEDNGSATLNGLTEGIYSTIKNGSSLKYDLMKVIPDSQAKEVRGKVPPALAIVDYRAVEIESSDIYCGGSGTAGGYDDSGWSVETLVTTDNRWRFMGILAEGRVTMKDTSSPFHGLYTGAVGYSGPYEIPAGYTGTNIAPSGRLYTENGYSVYIYFRLLQVTGGYTIIYVAQLYDPENTLVATAEVAEGIHSNYSPTSLVFDLSANTTSPIDRIEIFFHYIRATLLTASAEGVQENILDTGDYYNGMQTFQGSGLTLATSFRTSEESNGHRLVSGSDGLYFAPPDTDPDWIPLAEDNWTYGSLWYKIVPSVANGLTDPTKAETRSWTRCWTIGTCLAYLLDKITSGEVVFAESPDYSHFLYDDANPVSGGEQFSWLVTQKSNIMRPTASGAASCPVTLAWFLELLRNAFNCYYFLVKRNDGNYDFHLEHVEYFRRGGSYVGTIPEQADLTLTKPYRNFLRRQQVAKHLADGTNHYTYELDDLSERYTFSWQGDGGGDDFKGHPMLFRAGWIERGTAESHEVDNIFADLPWLMLNSGTDTASAKNYDGLFIFGAYRAAVPGLWYENAAPVVQQISLTNPAARDAEGVTEASIWAVIPAGQTVTVELHNTAQGSASLVGSYVGTGSLQLIHVAVPALTADYDLIVNFGANYANIQLYRIHGFVGNLYRVANVENVLRPGSYLQNGALAWPWLQCEYLHYDIPAQRWSYDSDDRTVATFLSTGTVKLIKKQVVSVVPVPTADPDTSKGVRTGLGTGVIDQAKVNLSSRNCEFTLVYTPS